MNSTLQLPSYVQWDITANCNLSCIHCRFGGQHKYPEMQKDQASIIVSQIHIIKPHTCAISGGEPTLSPLFFYIIEHIRSAVNNIIILTNGTTLTDQIVSSLRAYDISNVQISLDGSSSVHSSIRKSSSFADIIQSMRTLKKFEINFWTKMTIMNENMDYVKDFINISQSEGASFCVIGRCKPIGNAASSKIHSELLKKSYSDAYDAANHYGIDLHSEDKFFDIYFSTETQNTPGGCGAGRDMAYIDPFGKILFCPYLPVLCGDLLDEPFMNIWNSSEAYQKLRHIDANKTGKCKNCLYLSICGGCPAVAYAETGSIFESDPHCWL